MSETSFERQSESENFDLADSNSSDGIGATQLESGERVAQVIRGQLVWERNGTSLAEQAANGDKRPIIETIAPADIVLKLTSTDGARLELPKGLTISKIVVDGDDVYLVQPNGTVIQIEHGASLVPTLVVGSEVMPAEIFHGYIHGTSGTKDGQPGSLKDTAPEESGGGVLSFFGDILPGLPYTPLLPPTELVETQPPEYPIPPPRPEEPEPVNGLPTAGEIALVDDDDQALNGHNDSPPSIGDDNQSNLTGTLPHNFGSDGAGSIDLAVMNGVIAPFTSGGLVVTYSWNAGSGTLSAVRSDGAVVFTLTVDPTTGAYVFDQLLAADHPHIDNSEDPNITFDLTYTVRDSNGDSANGTISVTIDDDIPVLVAQPSAVLGVDEDALTDGNITDSDGDISPVQLTDSINLIGAVFSIGADQPGAVTWTADALTVLNGLGLTSDGAAVTFTADATGTILTGATATGGVLILTLAADGTLSVQLLDQIDHPDSPDNVETNYVINLSAIITATDEDGDSIAAPPNSILINIGDDIPVLDSVIGGEAQNNGGVPGDLWVDNVIGATDSGQAIGSTGADQPGHYALVDATGVAGVDYTISADGTVINGYFDLDGDGVVSQSEQLYTLTLDPLTGAYEFTMLAPLPNPDPIPLDFGNLASGATPSISAVAGGTTVTVTAELNGLPTTLQISQANPEGIGVTPSNNFNGNGSPNGETIIFDFTGTPGCVDELTLNIKQIGQPGDVITWTADIEGGGTATGTLTIGADGFYTITDNNDDTCFTHIEMYINGSVKLGLEGNSITPPPPDLDLAFDIQLIDADGDAATLVRSDFDGDGDPDSFQVHIEADGVTPTTAPLALSAATFDNAPYGLSELSIADIITDYGASEGELIDLAELFPDSTDDTSLGGSVQNDSTISEPQVEANGGSNLFTSATTLASLPTVSMTVESDYHGAAPAA